jgi:PAS domain S-box-containing protein
MAVSDPGYRPTLPPEGGQPEWAESAHLPRRFLAAFISVSLLGLVLLSYVAYRGMADLEELATEQMEQSRKIAVDCTTTAMDKMAETLIRQRAEAIAAQVGLYLAAHPAMTIRDLQADERFQSIAVQPVGATGYSALADYETLMNRFHKNPRIIDSDLAQLSVRLPGFWHIMNATAGGRAAGGYYDWREADGTTRRKYMWIAIAPGRTADGVGLNVAATTYIDEISQPSARIERVLVSSSNAAIGGLRRTGAAGTRRIFAVAAAITMATGVIFGAMTLLMSRARRLVLSRTAELRASEQRYRSVYSTAPLAFVMWDRAGRITDWNDQAEAMFGWSREEAVGRNLFELLVPEDARSRLGRVAAASLRGEVARNVVNENLTRSGERITCQWNNAVLYDSDGSVAGALSLALDITESKRAEEELHQAKESAEAANRAKSEFLANMSHEIRTPMTAILGFADVLLEEGNLDSTPPERIEVAQTIKNNGQYLLGIINDILDLSKIEAGKMAVERIACSPCRIVAELASLMRVRADAKGLSLHIAYAGTVPETVQTDPTRLRQVLVNVVANAIKFTKAGEVRLITSLEEENGRPLLQFDVVDTGIGMSREQAARLFQPFTQADTSTTRNFGGTGLGLVISQRLAGLLGGDVVLVDARPGCGTHFRVRVATGPLDGVKMIDDPMSATTTIGPDGGAGNDADKVPLHDCAILVAEDAPANQHLIGRLLKKAGADVTVVENGKLAVGVALSASDAGRPFQVILMDIQMPVMDGYEATALLRRSGYTGTIIALTAHAMPSDREKCIAAGCDDYATKPIQQRELLDKIRAYLCVPAEP